MRWGAALTSMSSGSRLPARAGARRWGPAGSMRCILKIGQRRLRPCAPPGKTVRRSEPNSGCAGSTARFAGRRWSGLRATMPARSSATSARSSTSTIAAPSSRPYAPANRSYESHTNVSLRRCASRRSFCSSSRAAIFGTSGFSIRLSIFAPTTSSARPITTYSNASRMRRRSWPSSGASSRPVGPPDGRFRS